MHAFTRFHSFPALATLTRAAVFAAIGAFAFSAGAAVRTVTSLADSGLGTLRDTIAASAAGDTIVFSVTGVIGLTSAELSINHNLTITGPGPGNLTITRSTTNEFSIFYFDNGTWTLSGLTIKGGRAPNPGGGIYNGNGTLTVSNCVITGNFSAQNGGGLGNDATMIVDDCSISNNIAGFGGGGIANGLNTIVTSLVVRRTTLNDNTAQQGGGAIVAHNYVNITNCTFNANHGEGNAIDIADGTTVVQSCTFNNNSSRAHGTIYAEGSGSLLRIGNSILSGTNGNLWLKSGAITSFGYNLSNDDGGGFLGATNDQILVDPKLDGVGLQSNGGFVKTLALTAGSPAIDAGKSFGLTTDAKGSPRTYDNPGIANASGGDGTDIGAYEAPSDPLQSGPIYFVNSLADHDDGVCGGGDCTLREALNKAASVGSSGEVRFLISGTLTTASELTINSNLTITGPGARTLSISGNGLHRIFTVGANTWCTLSGLTFRSGNPTSGDNHGETEIAGAILNYGTLAINDCAFIQNGVHGANNIVNGGNGGGARGGAIYNANSLTVNRCTFSGNTAGGTSGTAFNVSGQLAPGGNGGDGEGGAIYNDAYTLLNVVNCTFYNNTASGGSGAAGSGATLSSGGSARGGAIFNLGGMTIDSATINGNTGLGGAGASAGPRHGPHGSGSGGLSSQNLSISQVINTICAGNTGNTAPDAEGAFEGGYNIIGITNQSTGFSNEVAVGTTAAPFDPKLDTFLQNNGGPTDTMLLLNGSIALDHGYLSSATNDQRGLPRPIKTILFTTNSFSDGRDIGAVEMNLNRLGGLDSDGDGMPDDYEVYFGFNRNDPSDAALDADGDGMSNLQEYIAGTNPLDSNSALRIVDVQQALPYVTVTFATVFPHRGYRLERTDSLNSPNWNAIPGVPDISVAVIGSANLTDDTANGVQHFYRIRVLPQP